MNLHAIHHDTHPLRPLLGAAAGGLAAALIGGLALGTLAGCAGAPAHEAGVAALAGADCTTLQAQIAHEREVLQAAEQKEGEAWKAVIPFAVIARYGSGRAAAAEAEERLQALRTQAALRGCIEAG
jgi:hypothetical protein